MVKWFETVRQVIARLRGARSQPLSPALATDTLPVVILPPPPPSAPLLPNFSFRPSEDFSAAMGANALFTVANPLDLMLQGMNLMPNVLVVDMTGPSIPKSTLWLRFNQESLSTRGVSACRLFVDADDRNATEYNTLEWVGVCGWVMDCKLV